MKTGIVVLAAGASTRLGRPKQILRFGDNYLIQHIINACLKSKFDKTAVVLGYHYAEIKASISAFNEISILHNKNWKIGISESIKMGLRHFSRMDAVGFCTVDQVFLSSYHLDQLIKGLDSHGDIISSHYNGNLGTPALFGRNYYPHILKEVTGDRGAKKILDKFSTHVKKVSFAEGHIDIDTPDDLEHLN